MLGVSCPSRYGVLRLVCCGVSKSAFCGAVGRRDGADEGGGIKVVFCSFFILGFDGSERVGSADTSFPILMGGISVVFSCIWGVGRDCSVVRGRITILSGSGNRLGCGRMTIESGMLFVGCFAKSGAEADGVGNVTSGAAARGLITIVFWGIARGFSDSVSAFFGSLFVATVGGAICGLSSATGNGFGLADRIGFLSGVGFGSFFSSEMSALAVSGGACGSISSALVSGVSSGMTFSNGCAYVSASISGSVLLSLVSSTEVVGSSAVSVEAFVAVSCCSVFKTSVSSVDFSSEGIGSAISFCTRSVSTSAGLSTTVGSSACVSLIGAGASSAVVGVGSASFFAFF